MPEPGMRGAGVGCHHLVPRTQPGVGPRLPGLAAEQDEEQDEVGEPCEIDVLMAWDADPAGRAGARSSERALRPQQPLPWSVEKVSLHQVVSAGLAGPPPSVANMQPHPIPQQALPNTPPIPRLPSKHGAGCSQSRVLRLTTETQGTVVCYLKVSD